MGCCASRQLPDPKQPEFAWVTDESWTATVEAFRQKTAGANTNTSDTQTAFEPAIVFDCARQWLNTEYPECARDGTIEDMGEFAFPTQYTGVILANTVVVAIPPENGQDVHHVGAMLNSPEMEGAKHTLLSMLALMMKDGVNVDHAEAQVIIGADMVRCRFRADVTVPAITLVNRPPNVDWQLANVGRPQTTKESTQYWQGPFLPYMFIIVIDGITQSNPGTTVWDEGEFPFQVGTGSYTHPTRLLVARSFHAMNKDINVRHYMVKTPHDDPDDNPTVLLRNLSPEKDPGGIVHITLIVGISDRKSGVKPGEYAETVIMTAAQIALLKHVVKLNQEGHVQRCVVEVIMGCDKARYSFIGRKFNPSISTANQPEIAGEKEPESKYYIDGFSATLELQDKHELFESESQFQAVKQTIQQRAGENPERYQMLLGQVGVMSARHFLETNFAESEISDEGEFPVTIDGDTITISDTRLMVARDKTKEKNNIIAVLHVVPNPRGGDFLSATGTNWLESKEMKAAEEALLALMKTWHKEEKISDEDCMAQVMMGTDASIYKFADGERFEDYDEERMKQIKWM